MEPCPVRIKEEETSGEGSTGRRSLFASSTIFPSRTANVLLRYGKPKRTGSCLSQSYQSLSPFLPFGGAIEPNRGAMLMQQNVAAYLVINVAIARAFLQQSFSVFLRQRGAGGPTRGILPTMMSSQPGISWRRVPLGLGSWRVESVVDSQEEPNCMFVFLFDDGSVIFGLELRENWFRIIAPQGHCTTDLLTSLFRFPFNDNCPSVHTAVSGAGDSGEKDQHGRWRVRGNEFSLTVERRSKSRMLEDLRYVGVLKKFSKYIEGSVIEGQMDPAVVGKFKMTPLVSSMASDLKKAAEANDSGKYVVPKYSKSAIAGEWVLMWQNTGAVFRICLSEDGQFESVGGLGAGHLGGRWNIWETDRMFMTVVRSKSHGVQLNGDTMFWGTTITGPPESEIPLKITGYVMYGFLEPTCVGRFIMRRSQEGQNERESADDDGDHDFSDGPADVESFR